MTIEYFDAEAARQVVDHDTPIERVASGFVFTEGALWHGRDHYLLFSDIDASCMYRWDERSGVSVFRSPSNMTNGNTWDAQGRLLSCEHASSRVVRTLGDGTLETIASHFEGRELNSPNDIVTRRDGSIYFSDPIFGRRLPHGTLREPQLDHSSVYRITHTGGLQRLAVDLEQPNGLCFSPDERLLYVNDSPRKRIHVHTVRPDGLVDAGRLFADVPGDEPGVPDGMKVDAQGRVYSCGPGGIHIFLPSGQRIARIRFPEKACNFAFAHADLRTLYVTACTSVYRVRLNTPGIAQWHG